jgi:hypothetical protein
MKSPGKIILTALAAFAAGAQSRLGALVKAQESLGLWRMRCKVR